MEPKNMSGTASSFGQVRQLTAMLPRAFLLVWQSSPGLTLAQLSLNTLSSFSPAFVLWMTKHVVDLIVAAVSAQSPEEARHRIPIWILCLALVWIAQNGFTALENLVTALLKGRVEQHTNILIMRKCAQMDMVFFENAAYHNMIENATRGALMSTYTVVSMMFSFGRSLITATTMLLILSRVHWSVVLVIIATTAPQMIASAALARRHWVMLNSRAEDYRLRHYLSYLTSQPESAKEIRLFGLSEVIISRFRGFCDKFIRQEVRYVSCEGAVNVALGVLAGGGAAGCWMFIALRAVSRAISVGDVVMFTQAISNAQTNLISLFSQGGTYCEQVLFLRNLFLVLDLDPRQVEGSLVGTSTNGKKRWGDLPAPTHVEKGVEFRGVSFRYPGHTDYVLRNVSFLLRPGESAALVGRNGAGKTTLIKLLVRLYDPVEGEILYEGRNLKEYDLHSLHRCFGVIFQDFVRYTLTARENIGFGQVEHLDDLPAIQSAARKAGANAIIDALPQRYDTYLGKIFGGVAVDLSGGQWQRVGMARAHMRTSPILILDEPTASLDAFGEYDVYRSFEKMMAGRISVVISHRFSTVKHTSHIIVLDQGQLIEEGPHDALMAQHGLYAEMFSLQAQGYTRTPVRCEAGTDP